MRKFFGKYPFAKSSTPDDALPQMQFIFSLPSNNNENLFIRALGSITHGLLEMDFLGTLSLSGPKKARQNV